jgi:hypothetical protein
MRHCENCGRRTTSRVCRACKDRAEGRPNDGLSSERSAKGKLQRACLAIIQQMAAAGEVSAERPTDSRFVYYQIKQGGYPLARHAKRRDDQDVIDAVKHLRDVEAVPWPWISDETRSVEGPVLAPTVEQWMAQAVNRARISPWPEDGRPLVICESRGVRAALRAAAWRYGAQITSVNGQVGGFLNTEVVPLLTPRTPVAYFGDWNPAGSMIERNTRRVLERETGRKLNWQRLAITPELVAAYNEQHPGRPMPPKPGTDRRFSDGNPHDSYEAEALGAAELNRLLVRWLDGLHPADVQEREEGERAAWRARHLEGGEEHDHHDG